MIRFKVQPSSRLRHSGADPSDLPGGEIELPAVPNPGDGVELEGGAEFTVVRCSFTAGDPVVWLILE